MNRILKVQEHLQKEAELKLSNLEEEALELQISQEALIQSMNDHETLHGLFVDVAAKRLQGLSAQASRVETAKIAQKAITLDRAMQAKRTEKMLTSLKAEDRRQTEKKDLISILESFTRKDSTSFP